MSSAPEEDLAGLRREYDRSRLSEETAAADPIVQFEAWFADARATDMTDPHAMTLATATPGGQPSARLVLLKGVSEDGFAFYTNYRSRKGRELAENPRVALVFWWPPLERQVRIEGAAHKLPAEASDAYFRGRPRRSQLSAQVSPQSQVIEGREGLEKQFEEAEERFAGREDVPRPGHWGGYRVAPERVEFWQGRSGRLHDRLRYRRAEDDEAGDWTIERLAP